MLARIRRQEARDIYAGLRGAGSDSELEESSLDEERCRQCHCGGDHDATDCTAIVRPCVACDRVAGDCLCRAEWTFLGAAYGEPVTPSPTW